MNSLTCSAWRRPGLSSRNAPVGDTGHHEPRHVDAIVAAELERALADPETPHGIAQRVARLGVASVLDPDGVRRSALGAERMARKLRDALPAATSGCVRRVDVPASRSCRRG